MIGSEAFLSGGGQKRTTASGGFAGSKKQKTCFLLALLLCIFSAARERSACALGGGRAQLREEGGKKESGSKHQLLFSGVSGIFDAHHPRALIGHLVPEFAGPSTHAESNTWTERQTAELRESFSLPAFSGPRERQYMPFFKLKLGFLAVVVVDV